MAGSNKRQRGRMLSIRLTEAERLLDAASRAGLSLGGFARQVLLDAPPPTR